MDDEELRQLLAETDTADAARLLARMEPDEAADALRDLGQEDRAALLAALPAGGARPARAGARVPRRIPRAGR